MCPRTHFSADRFFLRHLNHVRDGKGKQSAQQTEAILMGVEGTAVASMNQGLQVLHESIITTLGC